MPRKRKAARPAARAKPHDSAEREPEVRIIGGQFRGRRLRYHGERVVRPMKHRIREAIFNLITTEAKGRYAIDLFAGTGALGLEALSRGAAGATFIERHVPSARVLEENIRTLGVEDRTKLLVTSAFLWAKRDLAHLGGTIPSVEPGGEPADTNQPADKDQATDKSQATDTIVRPAADVAWLVFCSPPYAFYADRQDEMLDLIQRIQQAAPPGSVLVVEADEQFDFDVLRPRPADDERRPWDVRPYPPAVIGIWRRTPLPQSGLAEGGGH